MGGGQPQRFGVTGPQPVHPPAPVNPYGGPGGPRATISGAAGTFEIQPGVELFIGRDQQRCQVFLQEPRVSGTHASVRFEDGRVIVRDMGSNNGTLINGNQIAPNSETVVPPGSMLRLGPVEFVVRVE